MNVNFVTIVALEKPEHFLKMARAAVKHIDVVFKETYVGSATATYTLMLNPGHSFALDMPSDNTLELEGQLHELGITVLDARVTRFTPAMSSSR
jgi:hypothetical protein